MNIVTFILSAFKHAVDMAAGVPAIKHAFLLSAGIFFTLFTVIVGGLIALWVHQENEKKAYRLLIRNRRARYAHQLGPVAGRFSS